MWENQRSKWHAGVARIAAFGVGPLIITISAATHLQAQTAAPVPEIDASGIAAGLGLLTAGVLILRARRRSK